MRWRQLILALAVLIAVSTFARADFVYNPSGGSAATGSQYQVATFTATNVFSGNANLLTDASNDLLVPSGALGVANSIGTNSGWTLGTRDPNGDLNGTAVPTFRATSANIPTALDIIPNGAPTDGGYGVAWNDICNGDVQNGGSGNYSCLHLAARSSGIVDIGENSYGTGTVGQIHFVQGPGNGSGAGILASFSQTSAKFLLGSTIQSTGGTAPTATCSGGSTGVSITAGSTNNRGQIVTSSSASTNCTITFSAAGVWGQAPFCVATDASGSITPTAVAIGTVSTSSVKLDFASATSLTFNYMCM